MIKLVCENCKKEFYRYPSNIKQGTKHNFCSKQCKIEFNKGIKEKRVCKQCNKTFYVYKSSITSSNASGNFCCRKCYTEYQKTLKGEKNNHYTRINCKCDYCGKNIKIIPSKRQTYKFSFCNVECRAKFMSNYMLGEKNPLWKGGTTKSKGNFESVKKQYFNKINFCAICGTTLNIHIHHIIPYRLSHDNGVDNLIPLCNKHHKMIEDLTFKFTRLFDDNNYDKAKYYLNLILREQQLQTFCVLKEIKNKNDS